MSLKELSLSEKLTYSTVLLKAYYEVGYATGTGFVFNLCENGDKAVPVIVTNKHVVENSKYIEFEFCTIKDDDMPDDLNTIIIRLPTVNWYFHPEKDVDLCCLPIASIINNIKENKERVFYVPLSKNLIPLPEEINGYCALEEVSMIGYPIGLSDTYNHKPIIRRGITATHIRKDYQGKKEFLVDMACYPGSSGSPIFLLNDGTYMSKDAIYSGGRIKLIGILYAGPQYNAQGELVIYSNPTIVPKTNIPTNLGVAIKSEKIMDFEKHFNELINMKK